MTLIAWEPHEAGVVIPVKAQAGARRNGIAGVHDGRLKVAVTKVPEQGKANQAIAETLAAALGVAKSRVELIGGPTSPLKRFLCRGVTAEALEATVRTLLDSGT